MSGGVDHRLEAGAVAVFLALFAVVTVLGFVAARWRSANLDQLDEWGLAGRRFGGVITWFLLGADIFTAYTFVFVPALVFGAGAPGFFALPYTIVVFPLVLVTMPRLWTVCHRHGYVTAADFVRGRFGSAPLALMIALTGLLATMPYIAVQLEGLQVVLEALGAPGHLPLILAFAILAAYTYHSGLRAPALIGIVKDVLIFATVLVISVHVSSQLGGFGAIFDAARDAIATRPDQASRAPAFLPEDARSQQAYATLALGSALALFLYPHVITGVLSARSAGTVRRTAVALPVYALLLGLVALMGYMAIAEGKTPVSAANFAVPDLILSNSSAAAGGFALGAIAIGAIVPVAIMSIAVANLFTRSIYKAYVRPDAGDEDEARMARLTSLVVKAGALAFVVLVDTAHTLDLQLLGGVWILQTLPAVIGGLYIARLDRRALVAGWVAGMLVGTAITFHDLSTPIRTIELLGFELAAYGGLYALAVNLLAIGVATAVLRGRGHRRLASEPGPEPAGALDLS